MAKPRVATTSLAGCFGCYMSLLDIDERILQLVELVEFDRSPINDIKRISRPVDIGLIEGGGYNPTLNLCIRLARATGKSLDELFWDQGET